MIGRLVVIGGGHGASVSLRAALAVAEDVAGIVTVADDGGSSGRLAHELGVLPMGDIRQCLAAMAPESQVVDLIQHRFSSGTLEGHVVGNLIVAAAAQQTGSFVSAIEFLAEMLGAAGTVVPPTLEGIRLVCEVSGEKVEGQVAVANVKGPITHLGLEPGRPKAYPRAIEVLESAEAIVLGPGSLFTSVLPPLLVPEVRDAYHNSEATKIYVCNLVAPPGETADFDAAAHLDAIHRYVGPDSVDIVIAHRGRTPLTEAPEVAPQVEVDEAVLTSMGVEVFLSDVLPDSSAARHDASRLAAAFEGAMGALDVGVG